MYEQFFVNNLLVVDNVTNFISLISLSTEGNQRLSAVKLKI